MNIQGVPATAVPLAKTYSASNGSSNSSNSSNSTTSSSNTELSQSAFLQLIATELQAQDPTNPLDPSQFMGQLVQFATLDQVTGIYNLLANGAKTAAGSQSQSSG